MENYQLDELDYKILQLIANDARISFLEVARICNVSGAAVHQRIQKMVTNNIISGSQFSLNYNKIGYTSCLYLKVNFDHTKNLDLIVESLASIKEIVECCTTLEINQLILKIHALNNNQLWEIINSKIKPLGIISMTPIVCCEEKFNRQISFNS